VIIDTTQLVFQDFPPSLNGEVFLDPNITNGYKTATIETCFLISQLTPQQRIANGWDKYESVLAGLDFSILATAEKLDIMKKQKTREIEEAYKLAESLPVVYLGVNYFGGRSSAQAINESLMMSEMAAVTTVDVYDVNNDPQTLTVAEAKQLILAIAQAAKTNMFNLNAKLKAVESAINQTELDTVVW